MKEILDEELASGNSIIETYEGWPAGTTSISLKKPFKRPAKKNLDGIKLRNINDPHYCIVFLPMST